MDNHNECIRSLELLVNTTNENLRHQEQKISMLNHVLFEGDNPLCTRVKGVEVSMNAFAENLVRVTNQLENITRKVETLTERVIYGAAIFSLVMPIVSGAITGAIILWLK